MQQQDYSVAADFDGDFESEDDSRDVVAGVVGAAGVAEDVHPKVVAVDVQEHDRLPYCCTSYGYDYDSHLLRDC